MKLNKTKVTMYTSEYKIGGYIEEFNKKCLKTKCCNCEIIKGATNLAYKNNCLARYIYERIIDTNIK